PGRLSLRAITGCRPEKSWPCFVLSERHKIRTCSKLGPPPTSAPNGVSLSPAACAGASRGGNVAPDASADASAGMSFGQSLKGFARHSIELPVAISAAGGADGVDCGTAAGIAGNAAVVSGALAAGSGGTG